MSDNSQQARDARINEYLGDSRSTHAAIQADHTRIRGLVQHTPSTLGHDIIKKVSDLFVLFVDTVPAGGQIALQTIIGVIHDEEAAIRACYRHARDMLPNDVYANLAIPLSNAPYEWFLSVNGFDNNVGHHLIRIGFRRASEIRVELAGESVSGRESDDGNEGPEKKRPRTGKEKLVVDPEIQAAGTAATAWRPIDVQNGI